MLLQSARVTQEFSYQDTGRVRGLRQYIYIAPVSQKKIIPKTHLRSPPDPPNGCPEMKVSLSPLKLIIRIPLGPLQRDDRMFLKFMAANF